MTTISSFTVTKLLFSRKTGNGPAIHGPLPKIFTQPGYPGPN